jgi:hypothetical protein
LQHSVGMLLRRRSDEAVADVLKITGQLADLAGLSIVETAKIDVHHSPGQITNTTPASRGDHRAVRTSRASCRPGTSAA